jgi:MFS family permease
VKKTSYAFAYVGFIAVLVQGGLLRRLLKNDGMEKPVALVGAALLALSLWLLPRTDSNTAFLAVCGLMALGNGLVTPVLSGMASRHVHGRAQGRVLGLSAAAGSLGRFLGPAFAALPLPNGFSEWPRPLTGEMLTAVNRGYAVAFTASAALLLAGFVVIAIMRPLEIKSPG